MTSDELTALFGVVGAVSAAIISGVVLLIVQMMRSRKETSEAHDALTPDHGGSLYDIIHAIADRQVEQHEQQIAVNDRQDRAIDELRRAGADTAMRLTREIAEVRTTIKNLHPEESTS